MGRQISYFANGHGDGMIVVGLAVLGCLGATIGGRIVTALSGAAILAFIYNLYSSESYEIAKLHAAADNAGMFSGFAQELANSVSIDWGLYVMAGGAALMIAAPLLSGRRPTQADH
jgi:hypothetical protein